MREGEIFFSRNKSLISYPIKIILIEIKSVLKVDGNNAFGAVFL